MYYCGNVLSRYLAQTNLPPFRPTLILTSLSVIVTSNDGLLVLLYLFSAWYQNHKNQRLYSKHLGSCCNHISVYRCVTKYAYIGTDLTNIHTLLPNIATKESTQNWHFIFNYFYLFYALVTDIQWRSDIQWSSETSRRSDIQSDLKLILWKKSWKYSKKAEKQREIVVN